jgi:hypothetical protein
MTSSDIWEINKELAIIKGKNLLSVENQGFYYSGISRQYFELSSFEIKYD